MPLREQCDQHPGYRSILTDHRLRNLLTHSDKRVARRIRRGRTLPASGSAAGR
ncbi:hypothetical protein GCM10009784_00230 [Arthrobacter parietis]|uniref:Uncharacterized protein n=1 Tax=Arthrobacter parietis TaxID=271434 RepID=A0ABP5MBE5_9MICC